MLEEVLQVSNQRREMKSTNTYSEENRKIYNKLAREFKKLKAQQCREQWLEEKFQEAEENSANKQDTKTLFQTVKKICGTVTTKTAAMKAKVGKLLCTIYIKNRGQE